MNDTENTKELYTRGGGELADVKLGAVAGLGIAAVLTAYAVLKTTRDLKCAGAFLTIGASCVTYLMGRAAEQNLYQDVELEDGTEPVIDMAPDGRYLLEIPQNGDTKSIEDIEELAARNKRLEREHPR
ncbi:MAG: hypothetical protein U9Q92_06385 [archaeon]|nr:hypothetical protein [archaeon]